MSVTKYEWVAVGAVGPDRLKVSAVDWTADPRIGIKEVLLTQTGGSMSFQFGMTPAQAREMAMALIAAAEALA